jgi:hypothetical protein
VARRRSPFAPLDKDLVLGWLTATGSHDPDVLERERTELLGPVRRSWWAGAFFMIAGSWVCFTSLGIPAGMPFIAVAAWVLQRGKRNAQAVREAFAEYGRHPVSEFRSHA